MIDLNTMLGHRVFFIPENQRGYSWTKKEIDDLFSDFVLMGGKCHYMGTVICTKNKDDGFMDEKTNKPTFTYTLEDGQQRLTTFLILINAIRERFIEMDAGVESLESKELMDLMTYKRGSIGLRIENKNEYINDCLKHHLLKSPADLPAALSPAMRCISTAVKYISFKLTELQTRDELIKLRNKVCHQVRMIDVDLSDAMVDRYLTFDAINSRGLALTEFDKIKNFCILVCERREIKVSCQDLWYKAVINLERYGVSSRNNENSFISDLYSIFHGETVSNSDVHDSFVKEYRILLDGENKLKENNLLRFVELWSDYSNAWGLMTCRNKDKFYGDAISKAAGRWLDAIDNLGLPGVTKKVLSTAYMKYHFLDDIGFKNIVRACEIYTFRMHALRKYRIDRNSKGILELSSEILKGEVEAKEVLEKIGAFIDADAPMESCIKQIINGSLNYKTWRNYLYYMLYEYELSVSPLGVAPINWAANDKDKVNSIEHILPQNHRDDGWWQKHWPDASLAEEYVHRIGNVVLTQGNSILNRKSIDKKIEDIGADYFYSHKKATSTEKLICEYTDGAVWKISNILLRELDIAKFVAQRWALPTIHDNVDFTLPDIFIKNVPNIKNFSYKFDDSELIGTPLGDLVNEADDGEEL